MHAQVFSTTQERAMPVRVSGTITIQRRSGARGAFSIGDLASEIGLFEVKDALIEEFEPGKYTGEFLISWIAPDAFVWRGRVITKQRATLEAMFIDSADDRAPAPSAPPEPDPIDQAHASKSAPPTEHAAPDLPAQVASAQAQLPADEQLLGAELAALVDAREPVKLDPTVDRQQFRLQRDCLKDLGYRFDARLQTWLHQQEAAHA
ncbi:MAG: DUF3275 family protein [Rubrivivax sp.]